jgi:hypothetical protein
VDAARRLDTERAVERGPLTVRSDARPETPAAAVGVDDRELPAARRIDVLRRASGQLRFRTVSSRSDSLAALVASPLVEPQTPRRSASVTAAVRSRTPSLGNEWSKCVLIVASLTRRFFAI